MPSVPLLPNPHGWPPVLRHYVQSGLHLFDRSSMAKQNLSHRVNDVCNGSPSRIRMVRRISLGITTRPKSSMRRTIPVAFIYKFPPVKADFSLVVSAVAGVLCTGSFFHNTALGFCKNDTTGQKWRRVMRLRFYCTVDFSCAVLQDVPRFVII